MTTSMKKAELAALTELKASLQVVPHGEEWAVVDSSTTREEDNYGIIAYGFVTRSEAESFVVPHQQ